MLTMIVPGRSVVSVADDLPAELRLDLLDRDRRQRISGIRRHAVGVIKDLRGLDGRPRRAFVFDGGAFGSRGATGQSEASPSGRIQEMHCGCAWMSLRNGAREDGLLNHL